MSVQMGGGNGGGLVVGGSSGGGGGGGNYIQSTNAVLAEDTQVQGILALVVSVVLNVNSDARRHIITGVASGYATDPAAVPTIALAIDGVLIPASQHAGQEGSFVGMTTVYEYDGPLSNGDHTFELWCAITSGQLLFLVVEESQWENATIVVEQLKT